MDIMNQKKTDTLVLDAGPLIKVGIRVKDYAENFVTIPEVLREIRDKQARQQLGLFPFEIKVRTPTDEAYKEVVSFSKKTGDFAALSTVDLKVLALTYMLEKEKCGTSHLRTEPVKASLNCGNVSKKPSSQNTPKKETDPEDFESIGKKETDTQVSETLSNEEFATQNTAEMNKEANSLLTTSAAECVPSQTPKEVSSETAEIDDMTIELENLAVSKEDEVTPDELSDSSDSDGGEWITPENLKHKQLESAGHINPGKVIPETRKVACLTTDYAMQSVVLQMNLALLSVEGMEIKNLRSFVLRCHACFKVTSNLTKQFCPSCGGPTLIRTSCSVDAHGNVRYYLKKNFKYNLRGIKYSIPTPKGGHKNNDLIFCEDQKEYQRARKNYDHFKESNLFDPDYLPGILTGRQNSKAHVPTIGHGRKNPNQARRRQGRKKS